MKRFGLIAIILSITFLIGCGGKDTKPKGGGGGAPEQVSFQNHIGPMILQQCGGCHVRQSKGELSLATYESIMKGSKSGKVIVPGDAANSKLYQMIESGKMPPKHKMDPMMVEMFKKWINAGADFDGDNPRAPIRMPGMGGGGMQGGGGFQGGPPGGFQGGPPGGQQGFRGGRPGFQGGQAGEKGGRPGRPPQDG
mgnify:CR=1 FL=1